MEDGDNRRIYQRGSLVRTLSPTAWDVGTRSREMDVEGVDTHVLSPIPFTFLYEADTELTAQLSALQNHAIAEACASSPERLIGVGTVPLQDPQAAINELKRCVLDLHLAGVEIGTIAGSLQLHDSDLAPFFAAAAELNAAIFVHPGRVLNPDRTAHHGLDFALARTIETALGAASLVQGRVLERHPELRVCLAHGGGCVPQIVGRWDFGHHYVRRPDDPTQPTPSTVLATMWADTLTYEPEALRLTTHTFGSDHLVLGTDYPFAARERPPGAVIRRARDSGLLGGLGESWQDHLTRNAWAFLYGSRKRTCHGPTIHRSTDKGK